MPNFEIGKKVTASAIPKDVAGEYLYLPAAVIICLAICSSGSFLGPLLASCGGEDGECKYGSLGLISIPFGLLLALPNKYICKAGVLTVRNVLGSSLGRPRNSR